MQSAITTAWQSCKRQNRFRPANQQPESLHAQNEKADADRKAWSKAEKGYKKRDPDGFKETKERVEEEKEALREQFEDELERQEKLRKHRMGVRH